MQKHTYECVKIVYSLVSCFLDSLSNNGIFLYFHISINPSGPCCFFRVAFKTPNHEPKVPFHSVFVFLDGYPGESNTQPTVILLKSPSSLVLFYFVCPESCWRNLSCPTPTVSFIPRAALPTPLLSFYVEQHVFSDKSLPSCSASVVWSPC